MEQDDKKIEKFLNYAEDPKLAMFDEILEISENIEELSDVFEDVDFSQLDYIQGEKGDKGNIGERGEKGDAGEKGIDGKDGKDGINGIDGIDGIDGKDGENGKDGKDGSPDTPEEIVGKIESLTGDKRLKATAIQGIEEFVKLGKDGYPKNLPQPAASLTYKLNGTQVGRGNILNIVGTGITSSTDGDTTTYNLPAGGGTVTVGPNEIAYGDNTGTVTSDADFTRLADGTTRIASTHGDVTASFVQRIEPSLGNFGIWGTTSTNNSTGATITHGIIDGTNIPDMGSDSTLATIAEFPATSVAAQQFLGSVGLFRGISVGADILIEESITSTGYEMGAYDTATPAGSNIFAFPIGAGVISRDLSSYGSGYDVYSLFGTVYADDTGVTSRVQTGKDIVDYVQNGTTHSIPAFIGSGTDDLSIGGDYTGAYTGNYSITVIGNNGARVVFNGGMTTGDQFAVGEVVTGSISGATAIVSNGTSDTRIWAYNVTGTGFVNGDILTGSNGNVSTAVTTAGNAPGVGDLFEVNYTDITNTNVQWLTGNQAVGVPFPGIGGITYEFGAATGHTPNDNWSFTASALYDEKQKVDITGTVFVNNANGTSTHSQDIPITEKITMSPAQVNDMNSNPVASTIAVPTGYAVQILEVYGRNTYNTTPYATNTTINIAFASAPTQSLWQQAVLLTETATTIRRFVKTSGSGADVVLPNDSLVITNTSGNPTAGDSDIDVYITYKLIEL